MTGATSPVGLRTVQRLTAEGWNPCCLLRTSSAERTLFNFGITSVVRGDCREPAGWEDTLEGVADFLHLAPIGLLPGILPVLKSSGVERLIALSSTRGLSQLPDALAEEVRHAEAEVRASGLGFTLLRSSMMYGARKDGNVDRVARWLDKHRWIPLIDGAGARIQPIHLDDVAEAILLTLERPESTRDTALILAGPDSLTWREMAETLAEIKGRTLHGLPVPGAPARFLARCLSRISSRFAALPEILNRLQEDRCFELSETRRSLGTWNPGSFRAGAERTYGRDV